ncbi:MAG: glycosyltransferase family 2 protein [Nocardioidaceae bacterium]|mgnify:FL=1
MRRRRRQPLLGIVVPAYDVAAWLPACLDSILASSHQELDVLVVDDGSPDESGAIAERYAARDRRVRVVHTDNHGLGAARNEGLRQVRGEVIGFCDSDDVVPPTAYAAMLAALARSSSDFVTGSVARWERGGLHEPPWMRRLHTDGAGLRLTADDHPEILGDVFAWNKLFRRDFWERSGLSWPEGLRYEDQPTTTRAFLLGQFDVIQDVVYHWRIRDDGTSITQQRSSTADLRDRLVTKRMSLASVRELGGPDVERVFLERVLAGDLWRYFQVIPGCSDEWWSLLRSMVAELWDGRSLLESFLPPAQRLVGWLVEQDRRDDAARVVSHATGLGHPVARRTEGAGEGVETLLDLPADVLDVSTVPRAALLLRPHES